MRDRIVQKAMEEINLHGIKFTMASLAAKLGVSKRTLYENFSSKEALIAAITDTIIADLTSQDQEACQNTSLDFNDRLKSMLAAYPKSMGPVNNRFAYDLQIYMPAEWKKIEDYLEVKWQNIEILMRQGIEEGLLKSTNPVVVKKMFIGSIKELFDHKFLLNNNIISSDAVINVAEVIMFGLVKKSCSDK